MSKAKLPDELPDHLQDFTHLETLPDLESAATATVEAERVTKWQLCDLCAYARCQFGKTSTAAMASLLGKKGQTVRRYQKAGMFFPPEYRYPETALTVYYTAAELADDPIEALHYAVDNHLTERELRDWLKGGGEQGEDVALTEWRELAHFDQPLKGEQVQDWIHGAWATVRDIFEDAALFQEARQAQELTIKVQVTGLFEKETEAIK